MDKNKNTFYVYIHYRKSDGLPFYVGKGKNKRDKTISGRSSWWKRVVEKHGFFYKRIVSNVSEDTAFDIEKSTIALLRGSGFEICNLTNGGDGMSGHKPSPETILKRIKQTTGKKRTAEQRLRMSLAQIEYNKNNPRPKLPPPPKKPRICVLQREDVKLKIKETKEKNNSGKGLKHPSADLHIYVFEEIDSGEIFKGTRFDFATYIGTKSSNVSGFFRKVKPRKTILNWRVIPNETEEKAEKH